MLSQVQVRLGATGLDGFMDRTFKFQSRFSVSFHLFCNGDRSLGVFDFSFVAEVLSSAFHTLPSRQYGNVVSTCKCIIFYLGDPIHPCTQGSTVWLLLRMHHGPTPALTDIGPLF